MQGDISAVAKALRDFSRDNPLLVIKGGLADGSLLSSGDLAALADLPPREVLLARLAGALAAPMQQMAGLLQALPRNMAYGISALIEQRQAGGETLPAEETPPRPPPRATPHREADRAAEAAAPAAEAAAGRRGCSAGPAERTQPAEAAAEARRHQRRRPPPKSVRVTRPDSNRTQHKTEAKKGRPGRWQP